MPRHPDTGHWVDDIVKTPTAPKAKLGAGKGQAIPSKLLDKPDAMPSKPGKAASTATFRGFQKGK